MVLASFVSTTVASQHILVFTPGSATHRLIMKTSLHMRRRYPSRDTSSRTFT
jgi:hypothetical protein